MKRYFIGIDISKEWLDVAVWDKQQNNIVHEKQIKNTNSHIKKHCTYLIKKFSKEDLWFCFEHTGNYGLLLSCMLEEMKLDYCAVPAREIQLSQGQTRGKNDRVDARRIAVYAAVHSHKLKASSMPSKILLQVKQLLTLRDQLVRSRASYKNSLKAHKLVEDITAEENASQRIDNVLEALNKEINAVEDDLKALLNSQDDMKKNLGLITSVKGIGLIVAASTILFTQNFTCFDDPRKFNCYTGMAPFVYSSGKSKEYVRTSKLRNKRMKALMINAANSAAHYDPQLKKYYKRKIQEGKKQMTVLNAIACKLVYRMFATVKRQSPYIILQN